MPYARAYLPLNVGDCCRCLAPRKYAPSRMLWQRQVRTHPCYRFARLQVVLPGLADILYFRRATSFRPLNS